MEAFSGDQVSVNLFTITARPSLSEGHIVVTVLNSKTGKNELTWKTSTGEAYAVAHFFISL